MSSVLNTEHIGEAEAAFARLVTSQVARVTQELQKLERLLMAGMVDPLVLRDFRKTIDQVRKTSWEVQQSVGSGQNDR